MSTKEDAYDDTYDTYSLGDFKLESGEVLKDAVIAYKTFGDPGLPVIVYPTWFSGLIKHNYYLLPPHAHSLSPKTYHLVLPALFGNSQSTSPSTTTQRPFPKITLQDNINAQYTLLTTHLKINSIHAVVGWSVGGMQAYQWAVSHPELFSSKDAREKGGIIPICATAKVSIHNAIFLEGVKSALLSNFSGASSSGAGALEIIVPPDHDLHPYPVEKNDRGKAEAAALKAMARVYAGWGFSQAFYKMKVYEDVLGFEGLEDFMKGFWEKWALEKKVEDLLSHIHTWQNADCSAIPKFSGDLQKALSSIKNIRALVLPGHKDLYFTPEDCREDASMMPNARFEEIPGICGHWGGGPGGDPLDIKWVDARIGGFLRGDGN